MHPTFFGIKRWHLQIVEASKRLLQPDSLTPARFDMMRAIEARDGEMRQRNLQYLLGVCGVTVSKMLKGLEEKGLVVRRRLGRDRREKIVTITPDGYKALRADMKYCVKSRINEYLAAALVMGDRHANIDSVSVRRRIEKANDDLVHGRRILRDRSPVRHPWSRADFATLPSMALVHERNRRPLRRPRTIVGAPLPWEISPKPLRRTGEGGVRGPGLRRGGARVLADELSAGEARARSANAELDEAEAFEYARLASEAAARSNRAAKSEMGPEPPAADEGA